MEIKRDSYLKQLVSSIDNNLIKVITGIRRCGKSYLLNNIFKNYLISKGINEDQIIIIQLDKKVNEHLRSPDKLMDFLLEVLPKDKKTFLFIDEIQLCLSVNKYLKIKDSDEKVKIESNFYSILNQILYDYPNVNVYVTGSNSKMLSKDVLTEFRGRSWEIKVFPLSFSEFYNSYKELKDDNKNKAWNEYLLYGGMPNILNIESEIDKTKYLKDLFKLTYLKDIVEKNKLENDIVIENLLKILSSTMGSLTNTLNLTNTFKSEFDKTISWKILDKYISCFTDSFLINKSIRYDISGKKYAKNLYKYYFIDTGLRNACLDFRQLDRGFLMETIIYNELTRRGYSVDIGYLPVWEKNKDNKNIKKNLEVDFVANLASKRYYIQSTYNMNNYEKEISESKGLLKIKDTFTKIIIEYESITNYYDENGVLHIGLLDFLLEPNILEKTI